MQKDDEMIDNELSLFGTPDPEPDEELPEPTVEGVAEAFDLAREILGNEANDPSEPGASASLPPALARVRARREAKAEELGLVARWGDYRKAKGHVSIHDPTSGSWHDLPWKDAPGWAQREAVLRSSLYRSSGDAGGFDLNAIQIREIWDSEHPAEEGIVEEHELPDD